jgi:hypothetical protein
MVGQDSNLCAPVTNNFIDAFKTIPDLKISSFQHFDSKCSIDNEIRDQDND